MPVNKDFYTLAGSSGQSTGYTIRQSIRFARTDNTTGGNCMHRTPSGAGNRKKWTFSLWFKLGSMNRFAQGSGHYYGIFSVDEGTSDANRAIWTIAAPSGGSDFFRMQFQGHGTIFFLTTRQFTDPSAWYHAVLVWDTAQNVSQNRQALYINGLRESDFQTFNAPSDEQEIGMNLASRTLIGASRNISTGQDIYRWDGYMADIHFLDGYAYGPEYFGEFDTNGIWIPKEYDGSYGSNGYKIDGRDASDLGDDESGNGNDFTTINHAAHDQVTDTPTNNFAVINPLVRSTSTHTEGNLKVVCTTSTPAKFVSSMGVTSGKWYMEFRHSGDNNFVVGITKDNDERDYLGGADDSTSVSFWPGTAAGSGQTALFVNNSSLSWDGSSTTWSAGDFIGLALNADDSIITMYKNGSSLGSYDYSSLNWVDHFFAGGNYVSSTYLANFGQEGTFAGATTAGGNSDGSGIGNFKYSVPTGYKALCTKNLGS